MIPLIEKMLIQKVIMINYYFSNLSIALKESVVLLEA